MRDLNESHMGYAPLAVVLILGKVKPPVVLTINVSMGLEDPAREVFNPGDPRNLRSRQKPNDT
jgi:hypothetical protein